MAERRISGWFILSAVFIIAVFGLFFTFTERKTWPEHRVELAAMDMRIVPPASTLWCEAVALYSDHPFVAYQVNSAAIVSSNRLHAQKVNLHLKLGSSKSNNSMKLKYFLLPSSVVEIMACSCSPGAWLLIFKGDVNTEDCLDSLMYKEKKAFYSESSEDSSEEDANNASASSISTKVRNQDMCPSLIRYHSIDLSFLSIEDSTLECDSMTKLHPLKLNISTADYYAIMVLNTATDATNHVDIQLLLDRAGYTFHKSGQAFDMCSLSTSCTIGLGFGTGDRVLVTIPDEPNAGRNSFVIRARCKPRLAVFAILSVFLPLLIFLVVAFVVRADRDRIRRLYTRRQNRSRTRAPQRRFVAPLLNDGIAGESLGMPVEDGAQTSSEPGEELPPPYHTLYEPPPPYSCVKDTVK